MDCSCMINFIEVPVCAKRTIQTGKSIPCSAEWKKIKHLSKYWGIRRHRTTSAGQILGSRPLQPLRRWRLWDSVTSMHAMMCPCDKTPRTLLSVVNVLTRTLTTLNSYFYHRQIAELGRKTHGPKLEIVGNVPRVSRAQASQFISNPDVHVTQCGRTVNFLLVCRAGFEGAHEQTGPPIKPLIFYFSLLMDANETTT